MKFQILTFLPLLIFFFGNVQAQNFSLKGQVQDENTQKPLAGVSVIVQYTNKGGISDAQGFFQIDGLKAGEQVLLFELEDYQNYEQEVVVKANEENDIGIVNITAGQDETESQDFIPVITINDDQFSEQDNAAQTVSGLLSASRDVFVNAAAFNLGAARFRIRGYDSNYTGVFMNGIPMNELENGRTFWSAWGGLNDVFRNRSFSDGINATDFTFGGVGGASHIDTRASQQRRGLRFSYAQASRSYTNRAMATYNTGMQSNGWALSLSASRRWAQEGYVPGSFYDAYSYFLSVDKKIAKEHLVNFTLFGAPTKRGRSSAGTQEVYDLAGTNYYNSYWGYQSGEVRNSRVANAHQPVLMLRHDWKINASEKLTTSVSYQFGRNGSTALDWYDAPEPRPDYYRHLPSAARNYINTEDSLAIVNAFLNDPNLLQVDWHSMYNINRGNLETIENVNGSGESLTGLRSQYIIEERRFDSREANASMIYENIMNKVLTFHAGAGLQYYRGENYKIVNDLLGGDFYLDIDKFIERDNPGSTTLSQSDLDTPNRIVRVGDRFGYDYDPNVRKAYAWTQASFSFPKMDAFIAGDFSSTGFWRTGNIRNGKFPNSSLGASDLEVFFNFGAKAGLTYKVDGRNYISANALVRTRAPFFRQVFTSPRTRNEIVPDLVSEKITAGELVYNYRSPYLKAKASAYYTLFEDQTEIKAFFIDEDIDVPISDAASQTISGGFVNYLLRGIDKQHFGVELAAEARLFGGLSLSAVAALGQYTFTSRPTADIYLDNSSLLLVEDRTVYAKNFYVPNTPQTAYSATLKYEGKQYWFANLSFNYFDDIWIDFNPNRRTDAAVSLDERGIDRVAQGSKLWNDIIFQEKAPSGYTLDFFAGKSFKLGSNYFLNLTASVNNILDNQNLIIGGFEQGRFDFDEKNVEVFPNRYYYMYGLNYFLNATFRINL